MRRLRIALVVSVALNLLVAGALAGAWLHHGGPGRDRMRGTGPLAPFAAAMTPEDRSLLLDGLRSEERGPRPGPQVFRERFATMLDAIRAEPFDRARLEAVLGAQRLAAAERQAAGERLLVDRIAAMSAEKRAAYADRVAGAFRRPPRR